MTASPIVVPFTLRFDHILLDARVNGIPATLVLDTGSGANVLDAEWATQLNLAAGRAAQALGSDRVSITMATIDALELGDGSVALRHETVALVPLGEVSAQHGRHIHGTIGFPFFMKYVVEIDYEARVLRLYDPAAFTYEGAGSRMAVDLSMRLPLLDAEFTGRDGTSMPARLLLDLGTGSYASVLTRPFVARHEDTLTAGPTLSRVLGTAVGGSIVGRVAALDALTLGGVRIPKPIVALPDEGRGFFAVTWADGTLGAPVLRRTRLILDYFRKEIIIEPGPGMNAPFAYDESGVTFRMTGSEFENVVIDAVADGSAAARAGIAVGDTLRTLDGEAVSGSSLERVSTLFSSPPARYVLGLEKEGQARDVLLDLEASALG